MIDSCPFCSHRDAVLFRGGQETRDGNRRNVYLCKDCAILYPDPRMDLDESESYLSYIHTNREGFQFRTPGADEINGNVRFWSFLGRYVRTGGSVLDVGAFDGAFCEVLQALGYDAHGIEPQERATAFANGRGMKVQVGIFPDEVPADLLKRRYSLISILETIYYFKDLKKSLNRIGELLEDGGLLLIKCHQGLSRYYDNEEHSYFSRYGDNVQGIPTLSSLRNVLDRSGFRLVKVFGIDSPDTMPINIDGLGTGFVRSLIMNIYNKLFLNYLSIGIRKSDRLVVLAGRKGG